MRPTPLTTSLLYYSFSPSLLIITHNNKRKKLLKINGKENCIQKNNNNDVENPKYKSYKQMKFCGNFS